MIWRLFSLIHKIPFGSSTENFSTREIEAATEQPIERFTEGAVCHIETIITDK
jgi:hypothetical protein